MIIAILLFLILSKHTEAQTECQPASCNPTGPIIRFPFRLTGIQPVQCGYPGFDLSCDSNNNTQFNFQYPVRATARNTVLPVFATANVREIDYRNQVIRVSVLNGSCLPNRVDPTVNSPISHFETHGIGTDVGFTFFNCSGEPSTRMGPDRVDCLSSGQYGVYGFFSYYSVSDVLVPNCVKMYSVSYMSRVIFGGLSQYSVDDTGLSWREPVCGDCEARRMYCGFRNNGLRNETQCFDVPRVPQQQNNRGVSRNVVIAVSVVSVVLFLLLVAALYRVYSVKKRKQNNERRIQQFLEDYKALRPTRYTYAEVKRITDSFKHQLGSGGFGTVFRGKLSNDIPVAVKVLSNVKGNGEDFVNEVGTIGKIHHVNVVRLVGYCADGYRRALVYEYLENDSLQKYISSGNQGKTIGWEKLRDIALGVAKGLDYLHQGCNQRILHFDIKPHNILLDHNLNPKVADFGLAKLCSKERSVVTMTAARGTIGYIAPEVFSRNFGKVSYKSDIYSFGMLLLDMVGGRRNFQAGGDNSDSQIYFPEWMYNQLEKGEDIAIEIEKEEDGDVAKRLIIVGLWCIQWYPVDRPSTKVVIQMLEGENLPIMPPNPFAASTKPVATTSNSSGSMFSDKTYSSFETNRNSH